MSYIAILDTADSYGPFYREGPGQTEQEAKNHMIAYLKAHVGDYKEFMKDIKIVEISGGVGNDTIN